MAIEIGERLSHYQILEKLGEVRPSWLGQAETGLVPIYRDGRDLVPIYIYIKSVGKL
jgi:hypothetical protein